MYMEDAARSAGSGLGSTEMGVSSICGLGVFRAAKAVVEEKRAGEHSGYVPCGSASSVLVLTTSAVSSEGFEA